jgi:thiamine kinase-like enzyme
MPPPAPPPGLARAQAAAAELWPQATAVIESLAGGITNENYKVTVGAEAYVIRVFGQDAELLLIDRAREAEITALAARIGVGPELVAARLDRGVLVTRFIPGNMVTAAQLRDPGMLREVARTLRKVHAVPDEIGRLDPFRDVDYYAAEALNRGVQAHQDFHDALVLAGEIAGLVSYAPSGLCHGDLLSANFICSDRGVFVVDWEYAGHGDPLFDLANMSVNHQFTPDDDALLLEFHQGRADPADLAKVRVLRFISALREAGWSYLQLAISALEVDFGAYADACLQTMRQAAAEPSFTDALRGLRRGRTPGDEQRPGRP